MKFAGDLNPASVPDPAWLELPPEERARSLQGRPVWQRAIVVAAGPVMNFLVAIVDIWAGWRCRTASMRRQRPIGLVQPGSAAAVRGAFSPATA